jgi:hypothetical protein
MPASNPPPGPHKRPWYLMAALIASWIYGALALGAGYDQISFYRGDRPDLHAQTDQIASEEGREAALAAGEHWLAVRESAEHRLIPFGVASLLLGGAMVLFAARSMGFREGSRNKLVQVVVVHAGIVAAAFFCSRDVTAAEAAFMVTVGRGAIVTRGLGDPAAIQQMQAIAAAAARALGPLSLLMSVAFSGLIVIALTRPRARAFFHETESGPLGEG